MQDMVGQPAGWYQDPVPTDPRNPSTMRFWDGHTWTAQVRPASRQVRRAWQQEAQVAQAYAAQQSALALAGSPYDVSVVSPRPLAAPAVLNDWSRRVTADGEPLAGWWARFGAVVVDGIITTVLGTICCIPVLRDMFERLRTVQLQTPVGATPSQDAMVHAILGPIVMMALIYLAVSILYHLCFLLAFSATPGKMLLGLEVRRLDRAGTLGFGIVLRRVVVQRGYQPLSYIPFVGLLTFCFWLLDGLWPLWDPRRQALHDKAARTVVVRTRG